MTEMVLLGAGASREAGIPTATEMTKKIYSLFEQESKHNLYTRIIKFVIGALLFQGTCEGKSPFGEINIEDVFNAIDLLANRNELQAEALVDSWHPLINKFDTIKPSPVPLPHDMQEKEMDKGKILWAFNSLINAIRHIEQTEDSSGEGNVFKKTQDLMIRKLVNFVWLKELNKIDYLKPLVSFISQQKNGSAIATLNYDNTIELTAKELGLKIDTGIRYWIKRQSIFPVGDVILYKLHGSIDWKLEENEKDEQKPLPHDTIILKPSNFENLDYRPAVIFGGRNKLTANGPFLDIFKQFEDQLKEAEILTVIGYSFQDEHVNAVITKWINSNSSTRIRIINGKNFKPSKGYTFNLIKSIPLRTDVILKTASDGIKYLYAGN